MSNLRFFYNNGPAGRRFTIAFTTAFASDTGLNFDEVRFGSTIWRPAKRPVNPKVPFRVETWTKQEGRTHATYRWATAPITIRIPSDRNMNLVTIQSVIRQAMLEFGCYNDRSHGEGDLVLNFDPDTRAFEKMLITSDKVVNTATVAAKSVVQNPKGDSNRL